MPQVTAMKAHRYGPKQHAIGDTYQISDDHLRLYKALGWVSATTPAPVSRSHAVEVASPPAQPLKRGRGRPRKDENRVFDNTYSRRDLVAAPPAADFADTIPAGTPSTDGTE